MPMTRTGAGGDLAIGVPKLQHGKRFERQRHGLDLLVQKGILAYPGHLADRVGEAVDAVGFDDDVGEDAVQQRRAAWC